MTTPRSEIATTDSEATVRLRQLRALVDEALDRELPGEDAWPQGLHRAMRYSLFAGGKRIRPVLVLASAEAVGGAAEHALPLACAVEMIHTYSLIHDDLPAMDNDDLRRGKPTCHKAFGEAVAILAGDALLTRAFHLLASAQAAADDARGRLLAEATAVLGEACGTTGLIGGQVEDLAAEGQPVDAKTLERIHRAKTGALLAACVVGGGILGGADAATREKLDRYGRGIGLAFQIVDDVLDATEGDATLGKTAGKDAAAGKATYVSLHGIDVANRAARDLVAQAVGSIEALGERGALLREIARAIVDRHA